MQLKKLEVERDRVEKWDGRYPTYLMQMAGVGKAPDLMLNIPRWGENDQQSQISTKSSDGGL